MSDWIVKGLLLATILVQAHSNGLLRERLGELDFEYVKNLVEHNVYLKEYERCLKNQELQKQQQLP